MSQNIFIVAGEHSADLYASLLIREMRAQGFGGEVFVAAGPLSEAAGATVLIDMMKGATVGLVEVLHNFSAIKENLRTIKKFISMKRPSLVVLLDMPDFNIRLGKFAKSLDIPVVYYVSPQVWAWRRGRIQAIAEFVKKMLVLFEFEVSLYRTAGVNAVWVGHPVVDVVTAAKPADLREEFKLEKSRPLIGMLPGSRLSQMKSLLPIYFRVMREIVMREPQARFAIALPHGASIPSYVRIPKNIEGFFQVFSGRTYDVMHSCDALVCSSGTSNLEAMLFRKPFVVTYRVHPFSAMVAPILVPLRHYCIVNILAGKTVVPELYQNKSVPRRISDELRKLMCNRQMVRDFDQIIPKLGLAGASSRAAREILLALA